MGNKTTWTEIASAAISNKVFLAEIEPAQEVTLWTLDAGKRGTYKSVFLDDEIILADGSTTHIRKIASKVGEDGSFLTEVASLALVEPTAGSFFHDPTRREPVNFTEWIKVDGTDKITKGPYIVFATDVDRDEDFHVTKSYGLGYFDDFERHDVDVCMTSMTSDNSSTLVVYGLANSADDFNNIKLAAEDAIFIELGRIVSNTFYKVSIYEVTGGVAALKDSSGNIPVGDVSYLSISRSGTAVTVDVYSTNELRFAQAGGDIDTLVAACISTPFEFIYAIGSFNLGYTGMDCSGYSQNLVIDPDARTGMLYVHPTGTDDPNDHVMTVYFWLYFATQGIELNGKYYEPYISKKGIPSISQSVESIFYGISVISSGDLQLLNHSGYFDQILDKFIWINKKVKLFAGGDDLPYSEYLQIYTGLITSKKYSRRELPFRLKSGLNPLLRDIPINNFWASNFPNLDPSAEGKPIPYYYGIYSEAQAPIVTCINTAYAGSLLQFQICDHAILSITQVYINFFDGDGWQTIIHGNEDLTNARFTISDAGFILGTTQVKVAFSGITDGGIVEKGPYIVEHLLTNFLGYTSSNLNTASFTASKAESMAQLNVQIENVTSALTIIEKICASDLAFFDEDLDGNFRYRSWAPSIDSSIPVVDDTDFIDDVPEVIFDQKDAYYKINVGYSYMSESRKHLYQEVTNNQTLYKYGKNDPLRQDTYIRGANDALVLAQRMAFILEQPSGQLEVSLKMQHMDLLVGDSLKITMARAPFGSASGWVQRAFEISKTEKRCFPVKNNLVLRDLAGYGSSVGFWVASTVPVWGSATQQEKEDSGWWSDANGYVATGEADSYNVSRWW